MLIAVVFVVLVEVEEARVVEMIGLVERLYYCQIIDLLYFFLH